MINDVLTASGEIFLGVILDAAAIASVITALIFAVAAMERALTKILSGKEVIE